MQPARRILCAGHGCGKTRRLTAAAQDQLLRGTPPESISALAPHARSVLALRSALPPVIHATTIRDRALALLTTHAVAADLSRDWSRAALLSGIDRRLLMRRAWAEAADGPDSLHARHADQPGALDWLVRLFDQLSAWAATADPARLPNLSIADAALAELWRAYSGYLALCRRFGVVAFSEVFNRAADLLRDPAMRASATPRLLLLDDLDLCQPAELNMLRALIGHDTALLAASAAVPRSDSPIAHERLLDRWRESVGARCEPIDSAGRAPAVGGGEYATPEDEANAIARQIAALDAPEQCAIVTFDAELIPLLQRALPRAGIAVEGQDARSGYTLAIAPLALAGSALLAGETPPVAEITRLLRHPALGLAPADARAAVDGLSQHFDLFDAATPRWPAELSDDARARLAALRSATLELRDTSERLSARIERWLERLDLGTRCWQQTEAVLDPALVEIDRQHWARWLTLLQQSETLRTALGQPLQPAEAADVFRAAQALIEPIDRPRERAVALWTPESLGGCAAHTVFVAGLHEGALPRPRPALPFGDDDSLAAAFGALPMFVAPQLHDRAAAWAQGQRDLQRAIGRASHSAQLSYSRADRQGRRRLPSPILAWALDTVIDRRGRLATESIDTATALESTPSAAPVVGSYKSMPEQPIAESPFQVSPSMIEDWFTCPRRCFYARRLNLYDIASSPRQALGTLVHNALNDLLRESIITPITPDRAGPLVERHWIGDEQRWGSRLRQTVFRRIAERAVEQMARYEAEHPDGWFVAAEIDFTWQLHGSDIVVKGRIDRIDRSPDGAHLIDYKLGQSSPSIRELLAEFVRPRTDDGTWRPGDIQLPVYALAIEQGALAGLIAGPVASVALIYPLQLYTDRGKLSDRGRREIRLIDHADGCAACEAAPPRAQKSGLICRRQLAEVERLIRDAVSEMRAGNWQPNPRDGSRTCAGCAFRAICPAPQ